MFISKREIWNAYPYLKKQDINTVMDINNPKSEVQYVIANGKPRPKQVRYVSEIEKLFGPIKKDTI